MTKIIISVFWMFFFLGLTPIQPAAMSFNTDEQKVQAYGTAADYTIKSMSMSKGVNTAYAYKQPAEDSVLVRLKMYTLYMGIDDKRLNLMNEVILYDTVSGDNYIFNYNKQVNNLSVLFYDEPDDWDFSYTYLYPGHVKAWDYQRYYADIYKDRASNKPMIIVDNSQSDNLEHTSCIIKNIFDQQSHANAASTKDLVVDDFAFIKALDMDWGEGFDTLFAIAVCTGTAPSSTSNTDSHITTWLVLGTGALVLTAVARKKFKKHT